MVWIKYTFSEFLSPLHKHEDLQWKAFWRRICPGSQTRGGIRGSYPQIIFVLLQIFLGSKKFVLNMWWKQKPFHPKDVFCPPKSYNLAIVVQPAQKFWGIKIRGAKMSAFRWITLFCLGKRLLKHKMTVCSKNLGWGMAPLPELGCYGTGDWEQWPSGKCVK